LRGHASQSCKSMRIRLRQKMKWRFDEPVEIHVASLYSILWFLTDLKMLSLMEHCLCDHSAHAPHETDRETAVNRLSSG
jgi:hypothetical protein